MRLVLFFLMICFNFSAISQTKTIHVFVALCDNDHQMIVRVPAAIGNGKDANRNLYWGAGYGVKTYFDKKTSDWQLVSKSNPTNHLILERLLFKHRTKEVYLLADAYDGEFIKTCIEDFLKASNGQTTATVIHQSQSLKFGGKSDLVAYCGHDGLMEFDVDIDYKKNDSGKKDAIILACYSKEYFSHELKKAQANPLVWTTHLMAPEAYTLKAAIDGWILNESNLQIEERAAQAYHRYQKCGIKGARNLFTTGF